MVYSPAGGDESALERRHQQLNQVFGIKQWKHSVRYDAIVSASRSKLTLRSHRHRSLDERSELVQRLYEEPRRVQQSTRTLSVPWILLTESCQVF